MLTWQVWRLRQKRIENKTSEYCKKKKKKKKKKEKEEHIIREVIQKKQIIYIGSNTQNTRSSIKCDLSSKTINIIS